VVVVKNLAFVSNCFNVHQICKKKFLKFKLLPSSSFAANMLPTMHDISMLPSTVYCSLLVGYKFTLWKYGFINTKFVRLHKSRL
jgi:hypothetical protein